MAAYHVGHPQHLYVHRSMCRQYERWFQECQRRDIVQGADKGLNCAKNIYAAVREANDGYIFSKSVHGKNLSSQEKEWLLMENENNVWTEVLNKDGSLHYRYKEQIDKFTYCFVDDEGNKQTFTVKEKRVVTYNQNLALKQRKEILKEVNKAKSISVKGLAKEEYGDHGEEELVIDDKGIRFVKSTVPYGFVATDAKVWWQNFVDKDGVEREYLLTEGYLWTGRYPDCKRIIEKGNHQSMELDRDSLVGEWSKISGEWSKFENDEHEYFIISDAVFSALCILGEDVEPCFEGANITKKGGIMYSLDRDEFKEKMLDFMADLKDALNNLEYEGGKQVENLNNPTIETP